jgi:tetratricopeptide (TPR) repeat protein
MKFHSTILVFSILFLATVLEMVSLQSAMTRGATSLLQQSDPTLNQSDANTKRTNDEQLWQSAIEKNPNDAEAYHQLGHVLVANDRLDEAIAAYNKAITLNSGVNHDVGAYKSLGDALVKQNKLDEALAAFRKGIELENTDVQPSQTDSAAYFRLGLALEGEKRLEEAADAYGKAIELNPEDEYISEFLGEVLVATDRQSEALTVYQNGLQNDVSAYYKLGDVLVRHDRIEDALQAYMKGLEGRQNSELSNEAIAYYRLASALEARNHLEEAMTAYQKVIELDPQSGDLESVYLDLARVLVQQNKLDEAWVALGGSPDRQIDEQNASVYSQFGQILLRQDNADEAIANCRQAIELNPTYRDAYRCLGDALVEKSQWEAAIVAYQNAIALDPSDSLTYSYLGDALMKIERLDAAISAYRQAVELFPGGSSAFSLGDVLVQQNRLEDALAVYSQNSENDSDAYSQLGNALVRQDKLDEAITACQKAIELNPQNKSAYDCLGDALLKQNKPKDAETAYRQAIDLIPQSAFKYSRLGNALIRQGQLDETIAFYYRKRLDWLPTLHFYFSTYNRLGDALMAQNRIEDAIAAYNQAIESYPLQVQAYNSLGKALLQQNKLGGAIAAFRRALAIDPNFVESLTNLDRAEGLLLLHKSDTKERQTTLQNLTREDFWQDIVKICAERNRLSNSNYTSSTISKIWLYKAEDTLKSDVAIRASISGLTATIKFFCFASTKIPNNPVILTPKRSASALPRRSSIKSKSALSSKARAIAPDSPGSNLTST